MEGLTRFVIERLLEGTDIGSAAPWEPFRPGIEIARIYRNGDDGPSAALLRYAPGACVPTHRHRGYEHIFVLEGSQRDERGVYRKGTLLVHAPGTEHSVVSDEGCVALAIWERPIEIL